MPQTLHPVSLSLSSRIEERLQNGALSTDQVDEFRHFLADVDHDLMQHRIITANAYTHWFQHGEASDAELRHFIEQFSVFSNQFLVAALLRVINAPSRAQARSSRKRRRKRRMARRSWCGACAASPTAAAAPARRCAATAPGPMSSAGSIRPADRR